MTSPREPCCTASSSTAAPSLSATQTIEAEYELHGGIDRLAAELETIAAEAQHDRFVDLLSRSGLTAEQHAAVVESSAFGPLTAALRRAEAYHHDLERLVPRVVGQHGLDDADDIAAVLRYRVDKLAATSAARLPPPPAPDRRSHPRAARCDVAPRTARRSTSARS